jgi:cell division protein FtsI (penicillin-binding protein 3)
MATRASGRSAEVRRRILLCGVLSSALLATGRAFQLGVVQGESWLARALDQQGDTLTLPAPRGTIYDRTGLPLAASREVFGVAIAPREVRDAARVVALLRAHVGSTQEQAEQYVDPRRRWAPLPVRVGPDVREALNGVHGIHFERVLTRFYPNGDIARELLGVVGRDGDAQGGMELEQDSVLRGRPGLAVVRRDSRGRALPGAMLRAVEPTPGRDIYLTIDYALQEIAEQALADALERTGAAGGELLLTDPATGEVLAAVSRVRSGRARNWRAATEPYEPGSTIKPFTVAALLRLQRAGIQDSVYAEEGRYQLHGRTLSDVKAFGWLTLSDALRQSSNIAIAKLAARLEAHEQYLALRDFGFGTPSGVSYPSESGGRLRRPGEWSKQSAASLAIGYELSVTPLQMAMAYAALANGGRLLEPRLVREVRSRDGRVDRSFAPRLIRQVVSDDVAEALRRMLVGAVEEGTGTAAALGPFAVAGKTGTARVAAGGRYRPGAYIASFAGYFPAESPQLVIVVKLDEPQGRYYGGATAAPVTRATLEAALAARSTPLDRSAIARPASLHALAVPAEVLPEPALSNASPGAVVLDRSPAVAGAPAAAPSAAPAAASETPILSAVPDVSGMPMRDGVRRLHSAGFQLRLEGSGRIIRTVPVAGAVVPAAQVVRVIGGGAA